MSTKTILLHGWSDTGKSFRDMKAYLHRAGIGSVKEILYGEYESREDNVTFHDVVDGLNDRMIEEGIIRPDGRKLCNVNVVVHSTGGLVIRHWIWRYYRRDANRVGDGPVRRVVMLAPANFGSPLAHRGKSFLGSLIKGRRDLDNFLEVGRQVLDGLELASPYTWDLAERDTLVSDPHFVPDRIQLTVLVGADGYSGLQGLVNKAGTDGTVTIAGTPLNSVKFLIDPCRHEDDEGGAPYHAQRSTGGNHFAFGVVPGYNHGSIVSDFATRRSKPTLMQDLLVRALTTRNARGFEKFITELEDRTKATYAEGGRTRYQQFVVRAVDDQYQPVTDYALEFFVLGRSKIDARGWRRPGAPSPSERKWSDWANQAMAREAHENRSDHSYRRFLIAPKEIEDQLAQARREIGEDLTLAMRVHVPPVDRGIRYQTERLQTVALWPTLRGAGGSGPSLVFSNTTTLLEIRIDRSTDYVWLGPEPVKR